MASSTSSSSSSQVDLELFKMQNLYRFFYEEKGAQFSPWRPVDAAAAARIRELQAQLSAYIQANGEHNLRTPR